MAVTLYMEEEGVERRKGKKVYREERERERRKERERRERGERSKRVVAAAVDVVPSLPLPHLLLRKHDRWPYVMYTGVQHTRVQEEARDRWWWWW